MYPDNAKLTDDSLPVGAFMQYVVDNYSEIAEAALIVPMDDGQASDASSALDKALGS